MEYITTKENSKSFRNTWICFWRLWDGEQSEFRER